MKLGIGIDTGGTYTDAVIYDFDSREILGSSKSLTTKSDLSIGILGAIDDLPTDLVHKAEVISLSTTLATNACVEDKSGRAKLIFFGGEKKIIDKYGEQYGLPPANEIYLQESFTKFSGEIEREPDWELFAAQLEDGFGDFDGVGIIEMNAMRNGAVVEKKAKEIFKEKYDIPVICGHELFSELNSLQRGSSTLLNAGLFSVISEFLAAVKKALKIRGIKADTIVIVRSDGSLMSEKFASLHPVETLLCGPAASAMGCAQLTDNPNSIVVDMGGTTTDIAFIKNGIPVTVTDGISIGKWKTFAEGLYVKTFGLGGDSAVHYNDSDLYLEERRVVPLCIAAEKYPEIVETLENLEIRRHTKFLYEHFMLMKDIEKSSRYTDEEKAFCRAIKERPLAMTEAAESIGRDVYTLNMKRLINDGVVAICGLTPTDVMHIKGDFKRYDTRASVLGAKFAAFNMGISVEEFCDKVYDEVKRKMYVNLVKAMLENKYSDYMKNGVGADIERFINDNYNEAKNGHNPLLSTMFKTDYTLVGVGAPIRIFLTDVAEMLGTNALIPEHHEVANALGAVVGSVGGDCSVTIKPENSFEGTDGYTVYSESGTKNFEELEDAIPFAEEEAKKGAKAEAVKRGATGHITVTVSVNNDEAKIKGGEVYLGTVVTAHAVGALGF